MSLIREIERRPGDVGLDHLFFCPACGCGHGISTHAPGPVWELSGPPDRPTIKPSVKVTGTVMTAEGEAMLARGERPTDGKYPSRDTCCHSVITEGQIHYEADCTHAMAGQTVPLPDF